MLNADLSIFILFFAWVIKMVSISEVSDCRNWGLGLLLGLVTQRILVAFQWSSLSAIAVFLKLVGTWWISGGFVL